MKNQGIHTNIEIPTALITRPISRDTTRRNERLRHAQSRLDKTRALCRSQMVLHRSNTIQNRRWSEQSVCNLVLPTYLRRQHIPVYMLDLHGHHRRLERCRNRCDDTAMHSDCRFMGQDYPRNMY